MKQERIEGLSLVTGHVPTHTFPEAITDPYPKRRRNQGEGRCVACNRARFAYGEFLKLTPTAGLMGHEIEIPLVLCLELYSKLICTIYWTFEWCYMTSRSDWEFCIL